MVIWGKGRTREASFVWPAAGFVDTEIRCFHEAGGGRCNDGSSGVSSKSRRYD